MVIGFATTILLLRSIFIRHSYNLSFLVIPDAGYSEMRHSVELFFSHYIFGSAILLQFSLTFQGWFLIQWWRFPQIVWLTSVWKIASVIMANYSVGGQAAYSFIHCFDGLMISGLVSQTRTTDGVQVLVLYLQLKLRRNEHDVFGCLRKKWSCFKEIDGISFVPVISCFSFLVAPFRKKAVSEVFPVQFGEKYYWILKVVSLCLDNAQRGSERHRIRIKQ